MDQSVSVKAGTTVSDAAGKAGIDMVSTCGQKGTCGQCGVMITKGVVPDAAPQDEKVFSKDELSSGYRLACCTRVTDNLTIFLPDKTYNNRVRLLPGNDEPAEQIMPTAGLVTASHKAHPLGLAIDLGTTTVACHLVDLITGKELVAVAALNPQVRHGEDIMSRLQYASSHPDSTELSALIFSKLNELMLKLTAEADVRPCQVEDVCIAANAAMIHLLLGLPIHQLVSAPYVPATCKSFDINARDLELNVAPGAHVHILPSIGGFLGGDLVAMILATGIHCIDKIVLGIDVGTNTEIVLRTPGDSGLVAVSCPSGPAFEGAHISNGMRAIEGAIESVKITSAGISYRTIGDAPAIGLCGSGILDIVAELYRLKWINERGRFQVNNKNIVPDKSGAKILLVPEIKNGIEKDIFFSQKDVNAFQLAKGAIRAGIDILLEVSGIQPDNIDEVLIAGTFGFYLNPTNAVSTGLIPDIPTSRIRKVGNASVAGAKKVLLSRSARKEAQQIADQTCHVELIRHPNFNRLFASGMLFHKNLRPRLPRKGQDIAKILLV